MSRLVACHWAGMAYSTLSSLAIRTPVAPRNSASQTMAFLWNGALMKCHSSWPMVLPAAPAAAMNDSDWGAEFAGSGGTVALGADSVESGFEATSGKITLVATSLFVAGWLVCAVSGATDSQTSVASNRQLPVRDCTANDRRNPGSR